MSADDPRAAALKFKEMATEKFKAGEFQIARYTYGSAMEVAEKNGLTDIWVDCKNNYALAAIKDRRFDLAARALEEVLMKKPTNVKARLRLGQCCLETMEFDRATELFTRLSEDESVSKEAKRMLATTKLRRKEARQAEKQSAVGLAGKFAQKSAPQYNSFSQDNGSVVMSWTGITGIRSNDIVVDFKPKHLKVQIEGHTYVDSGLAKEVKSSDCSWLLVDDELQVTLVKKNEGEPWTRVVDDIDTEDVVMPAQAMAQMIQNSADDHQSSKNFDELSYQEQYMVKAKYELDKARAQNDEALASELEAEMREWRGVVTV